MIGLGTYNIGCQRLLTWVAATEQQAVYSILQVHEVCGETCGQCLPLAEHVVHTTRAICMVRICAAWAVPPDTVPQLHPLVVSAALWACRPWQRHVTLAKMRKSASACLLTPQAALLLRAGSSCQCNAHLFRA